MKVLDLFSGIGGFSLGLERAGMRTVAFCEVESFCQKILQKHWEGVPIYDDVRTLTAERLRADGIPKIDLICGGFPCQPFSVAGRKKGTQDHRDLWSEMRRIIAEVQPTWVIGENVANFARMAFSRTKTDLENLGYTVQPFIIPACAVGAPHRRDRIWVVAYRSLPHGGGQARRVENEHRRALRWRPEPRLDRVVHGVPTKLDKARLIALGNAVVPQVVEEIGRAIAQIKTDF